ncbi:MAG: hypothetical protein IPP57_06730 [Candidatus Obscuribacter sp.]|nr:hypothetical protein [Candidatus Obscuribacter sp.]
MSEESAENQIGSGSQPSPEAAVGSAVLTADGGDTLKRLSPWQSSGAALGYVLESSRTDAIQLRTSDRITIIALLVCCILEVLSLSYTPLTGMRLPIIIFCDVVLGVSTVLFF